MSDQPTYSTGENVLCYHGPLIYVAKILKTQAADAEEKNTITGQEGQHYFVHYKGWKTTCVNLSFQARADSVIARWDEWVPATRLLKDNEVNRILQKSLQKDAPATAAAARSHPKASTSTTKDTGTGTSASANTRSGTRKETGTRGTKRGRDDVCAIPYFLSAHAQMHSRMVFGGPR
jgi:mortality factor 4-like protein 1